MKIHTQVDGVTVHHAGQLIRSMIRLAERPDELEFCLYSLKNEDWSVVTTLKNDGINNSIEHVNVSNARRRSVGHAQAVNVMLKNIDTETINIVADADVMIVMNRWDTLIRQLVEKGVGTFGTPYEDVGGITSGNGRKQTYKGLPNVICMLLAPGYPWQALDASPEKANETTLDTNAAIINGLEPGQVLFRDVGWRIPSFMYQNQVPYVTLTHVKPTSDDSIALKGLSWDYHEEYQLYGKPFCVHHRGASKHPYRRSGRSNAFYDRVWTFIGKASQSNELLDIDHVVPQIVQIEKKKHITSKKATKIFITTPEKKIKTPVTQTKITTTGNFLIASAMPMSGEGVLAKVLNDIGIQCGHERYYNLCNHDFDIDNVGDSSGWISHYINCVNEDTPIIHLVRHPCNVINEWMLTDVAVAKEKSHVFNTPESHAWVKTHLGEDWLDDDPWIRACRLWIDSNNAIAKRALITIRIEDIDERTIIKLVKSLGRMIDGNLSKALQKNRLDKKNIREKLGQHRLSESVWKELHVLAKTFGYNDL